MLLANVDGWIGGAQRQADLLSEELAARGMQMLLVNQSPGFPGKRRAPGDGRVERIALPTFGYSVRWSFLLSFLVWATLNRRRFHLIHAHSPSAGITAGLVGRLLGKPVVVKVPGMQAVTALARKRWLARWVLDRVADAVVAVSSEMLQSLSAAGIGGDRCVLIPNGVGLTAPMSTRAGAGDRPNILYVGRLAEVKGVRTLLRAWSAMRCRERATLLLVGDGPLRCQLEGEAVARSLGPSVRFLGAHAEVTSFYRMADIFVLPSESEGLSNALLEAMAAGLPVIASAVGGSRDVIEHGVSGFLVDWTDTVTLDRLVATLLDDDALRRRVGEAARRRAGCFSIATVADRYCELYRALVAATSGQQA